jgi:hypothetical protein
MRDANIKPLIAMTTMLAPMTAAIAPKVVLMNQ